jgi:adenylate cyclase class 2
MPDRQEIEVKFALSDPAALREALREVGAESQGAHAEMNVRLDDAGRSLTGRGIVLRLRRTDSSGGVAHILTVKTPAPDSAAGPDLSARREIELGVEDGEAMLAALAVLGYAPYWRYEKRRETFVWRDVEIDLDHMPYGWFVELEGAPEGIRNLAARLGFDLSDGLTISYSEIFDNVCRVLNLEHRDLTFDAFAGVDVPPEAYRGA